MNDSEDLELMYGVSDRPSLPQPAVPLCFQKDEFLRDNFDVDKFISSCRKRVPLEQMRDDLSYYLKVLQNAMIELINKDYADFVNLSSNLVGLDRSLEDLRVPLLKCEGDVSSLKEEIDHEIDLVEKKLVEKENIRKKKEVLEQLIKVAELVEEMEKLLQIRGNSGDDGVKCDSHVLERVAGLFNSLQFSYNKCSGLPLCEKLKPQILEIMSQLQQHLERQFVEAVDAGDEERLRQTLRSYASMDKVADVEALYKERVVMPYVTQEIQDTKARTLEGLENMYSDVLRFIPTHFLLLRDITKDGQSHVEPIRGYDFMARVIAPSILSTLVTKTPGIFDAGNPDIFIKRYHLTMGVLLRELETSCTSQSSVLQLRADGAYTKFMAKWSLPVYYQIRFYHIGSLLENALKTPAATEPASPGPFKLSVVAAVWRCLYRCWCADVYIEQLCGKFLRLSLQILSRLQTWLHTVGDTTSFEPEHIVLLIHDIHASSKLMPTFYVDTIKPRLLEARFEKESVMEGAWREAGDAVGGAVPALAKLLVTSLTDTCLAWVKQSNEIPRLYRRTNKEAPAKASAYVHQIFTFLTAFKSDHCSIVEREVVIGWFLTILNSLTDNYHTLLTELLVSVRRMEESLKKLKKARGTVSGGSSSGSSDDDKIRRQIYVDVKLFGESAGSLVERSAAECLAKYPEMWDMVVAAAGTK